MTRLRGEERHRVPVTGQSFGSARAAGTEARTSGHWENGRLARSGARAEEPGNPERNPVRTQQRIVALVVETSPKVKIEKRDTKVALCGQVPRGVSIKRIVQDTETEVGEVSRVARVEFTNAPILECFRKADIMYAPSGKQESVPQLRNSNHRRALR